MVDHSKAGYLSEYYAHSLAEFGQPKYLPNSKGWILQRGIHATPYADAMTCYPLFCCHHWEQLPTDLAAIDDLVSLGIVTDPFGDYDEAYLRDTFHHLVFPYKQHFVTDLSKDPATYISKHHNRNIRKAERQVEVQRELHPSVYLDDWVRLYDNLIQRHQIEGIAQFSRQSFKQQLTVPGLVMFRAIANNETVGMMLWYVQNAIAYYHLGAYSDLGYDLRASYALVHAAIQHFQSHDVAWLSFGAGAGASNDGTSGLDRFKKGWATDVRPVGFCGYIFDRARYNLLVKERNITEPIAFFPAYRTST